MVEEFIPTFETLPNVKENNVLIRIDDFEDKIKEIDKLTKEYDKLKKELKEQMVTIGKDNDLTQVKWITPKGIQITCSVGQKEICEEVTEENFSMDRLIKEYPEVYKKCCSPRTYTKVVKAKTNDVLRITLPKEEK